MVPESLSFLVIFLLILANGALAMSEIAIISARKIRLQQWSEDGDLRARLALQLANSPSLFLSTVQIGITLVGVLSGVFGGYAVTGRLAEALGSIPALEPYAETLALGLVVLSITYLSLIFGELVPKRLALDNPERIARLVVGPMRFLSRIASPLVRLLAGSTDLVLRAVGTRSSPESPITEQEIRLLIEQATAAGVLAEAEQEMVERVLRLGNRSAGTLMTPRRKITWLDIDDPFEKNLRKIAKCPHTRFPVCQGRLANILGVVHAKDFVISRLFSRPVDLKQILRQPLFVHETTHALRLLELFKESGNQMAVIIDEYGTVEGLVTLTDVLEAIVGDLPSLEQQEEPKIVQREDGSWLVDGLLAIDELKEQFKIKELPGEDSADFQTLGGFAMTYLKKIPTAGDHFQCCGLRFEILDMDGRRVDKVLVEELEQPGDSEPGMDRHSARNSEKGGKGLQ